MYNFNVEVKKSKNPKCDMGLFAKEFIPMNSIVWEFTEHIDAKVPLAIYDDLNAAQKNFCDKYGYVQNEWLYLLNDLGKFVNHSITPNTEYKNGKVYAVKDINIGDEIWENYSKFDDNFNKYKDELL